MSAALAERYSDFSQRVAERPSYVKQINSIPTGEDFILKIMKEGATLLPSSFFKNDELTIGSKIFIPIAVKKEGGSFFAENEKLGIYETGESYEEALQAFQEAIIYAFKFYTGQPADRFIGEATQHKRYFDEYFFCIK